MKCYTTFVASSWVNLYHLPFSVSFYHLHSVSPTVKHFFNLRSPFFVYILNYLNPLMSTINKLLLQIGPSTWEKWLDMWKTPATFSSETSGASTATNFHVVKKFDTDLGLYIINKNVETSGHTWPQRFTHFFGSNMPVQSPTCTDKWVYHSTPFHYLRSFNTLHTNFKIIYNDLVKWNRLDLHTRRWSRKWKLVTRRSGAHG